MAFWRDIIHGAALAFNLFPDTAPKPLTDAEARAADMKALVSDRKALAQDMWDAIANLKRQKNGLSQDHR
jgi:hypothetical protein